MAEKKDPSITWKDDFMKSEETELEDLQKSQDSQFQRLRKAMFAPSVLTKSEPNDYYLIYDTTAVTIGSQNGTGTVQINGVTTHSAAVKFNGALQSGGGATNITLTNNGPTLNGTTTAGIIATAQTAGTIASAATIAPTNPITFVSGTTQITTITAPSGIATYGGHIIIIPTGLWTTGTSGNIALATTAVVSRALIMTYDAGTSKWYPSY